MILYYYNCVLECIPRGWHKFVTFHFPQPRTLLLSLKSTVSCHTIDYLIGKNVGKKVTKTYVYYFFTDQNFQILFFPIVIFDEWLKFLPIFKMSTF